MRIACFIARVEERKAEITTATRLLYPGVFPQPGRSNAPSSLSHRRLSLHERKRNTTGHRPSRPVVGEPRTIKQCMPLPMCLVTG